MKLLRTLVLFLLAAGAAGAAGAAHAENSNPTQTSTNCPLSVPANQIETLLAGFDTKVMRDSATQELLVVGLNPEAIYELIQHRGISRALSKRLNSKQLADEMNVCFGSDLVMKRTYVTGLILSEVAGRVVATGAVVAAGVLISKVMSGLAIAYPTLSLWGSRAALTAAAGWTSYLIYQQYFNDAQISAEEHNALKSEIVSSPLASLRHSLELLDQKTDSLILKLNTTSDEENAALSQQIKKMLEHRDRAEALLASFS